MKTLLSWSSGKDSAWSLYTLKQNNNIELCGLFTTINEEYDRVAMHGVRTGILQAQAEAAGLPLHVISLPNPCPNEIYEERMGTFIKQTKTDKIEAMAFGDLFLEDIRAYREGNLKDTGIEPLFPVWGIDTATLANNMISGGLETYITCVDSKQLDGSFAGRRFDRDFLSDLPEGVDPCGENGEFHTMVVDGPMFNHRLAVRPGEVVDREGFIFADFILEENV